MNKMYNYQFMCLPENKMCMLCYPSRHSRIIHRCGSAACISITGRGLFRDTPSPLSPSHSLPHLSPPPRPSPSLLSSSVINRHWGECRRGLQKQTTPPPTPPCHMWSWLPMQGFRTLSPGSPCCWRSSSLWCPLYTILSLPLLLAGFPTINKVPCPWSCRTQTLG